MRRRKLCEEENKLKEKTIGDVQGKVQCQLSREKCQRKLTKYARNFFIHSQIKCKTTQKNKNKRHV